MKFVNKVFDEVGVGASLLSLSAVTACFLDPGGPGGLCREPRGLAVTLLQTALGSSPRAGLVDGAAERLRGGGRGSWSWIVVCGCRRSSSRQLHLNRVVVADCQGLQEGERRGGVTQGLGEP